MIKERRKQYNRKWYLTHRKSEIQGSIQWQKEHLDKKKEYDKRYRIKIKTIPEKLEAQRKYAREYSREWRKKNPEKEKEYQKKSKLKRRGIDAELYKIWAKDNPEKIRKNNRKYYNKKKNDLHFRIDNNMRSLIWQSLKGKKNGRRWESLVGYTLEYLIKHLEELFDDKMNWENYGSYWEIDHIKPRCSFCYTSFNDLAFKQCWKLDNLQPMGKSQNRSKNKRFQKKYGIEPVAGYCGTKTRTKLNELFS